MSDAGLTDSDVPSFNTEGEKKLAFLTRFVPGNKLLSFSCYFLHPGDIIAKHVLCDSSGNAPVHH